MTQPCDHAFEDAPPVFVATARTRACPKCKRVEVMLATTGKWISIDEFLDQCIANHSSAN